MPRVRSAKSDVSDGDMDEMAEQEVEMQRLQKLLRQYRIMENDRKMYCQESQDMIKQQRDRIEKLQTEQEFILKDLRLIESQNNQMKDERNVENLGDLGREKASVEQQIEDERLRQQEIGAELRQMEKRMKQQSQQMGGVHMSGQHTAQTAKNSRRLENQLQLANNCFCKTLEENRQLREKIDSLRIERRRFDSLNAKLESKRGQLKVETGEVIDQSTQAYDQRDEAQAKMILLKEKADKDLQQHGAEMKEQIRIIDHDRKLREFMCIKGKERQEDLQLVAWRNRKEQQELNKKKASQTDTVESYEAAFEHIKEMTGEADVELLVNRFIENEDVNFALFSYVNEQNNEIELLNEKIAQTKDEIDTFNQQGIELESQRQTILKKLQESSNMAARQANSHDDNHKGVMKILDQLKAGIESLFSKIGCERLAIDEMLSAEPGVTQTNMLQYLGIVEEQINHLLLMQAFIASQKEEEYGRKQPVLLGDGPQMPVQQLPIMPPAIGDEYEESDGSDVSEDDRPLTRNELTAKAMKSVRKRESVMRKEGFKYDLSDAREKAKKKDKKGH